MIPDPRTMTDAGLLFLVVVYTVVVMYIQHKLWGLWYRRNLEKNVGAFREGYCDEIMCLKNKLKEYERTHRTMV